MLGRAHGWCPTEVTLVMGGEVSQQRSQSQQCLQAVWWAGDPLPAWRAAYSSVPACLCHVGAWAWSYQVPRLLRRNQRYGFLCECSLFLNVCSCFQTLWFQNSLYSWKIIEDVEDFLFMWLYLLIFAILETKTGKLFNVYFSNKLIRC